MGAYVSVLLPREMHNVLIDSWELAYDPKTYLFVRIVFPSP